ncbi:MAG: HAD-IIIA family hydrolase [Burkholderiaceae bacterium]|nr:HAD-IIIA family hydrolase [Burkholderiaceae bacterium]
MHDRPGRLPAVFLDKDGTIVEDVPFNVDPARLRFAPNALAGLRLLASLGLPLVIVTNQSGLASGRFSRAAFALLRRTLCRRLHDEAGVTLAGWYTCPHAPDAPDGCRCRKPAPGLLRRAAARHGFALERSWMIGDILDDVEAGRRAGCTTVLLDVGNETVWRMAPMREPHYRCADLLGAAELVAARTVGRAARR